MSARVSTVSLLFVHITSCHLITSHLYRMVLGYKAGEEQIFIVNESTHYPVLCSGRSKSFDTFVLIVGFRGIVNLHFVL